MPASTSERRVSGMTSSPKLFFMGARIHLSDASRYDRVRVRIKRMPDGCTRELALVAVLAATVLAGCASDYGPSASELKARWDAENVYPQAYRQDLLAFFRTYLNDPSNVRGAGVS